MNRKQTLLKRHRRNKRLALLGALVLLVLAGVLVAWWLAPLLAVLGWVAHEAWFADHLFYSPAEPYRYRFPEQALKLPLRWEGARLVAEAPAGHALVLQVEVRSSLLGRLLDPYVRLGSGPDADAQTFERGCRGERYLNLTSFAAALAQGLPLAGRFCRLGREATLWAFPQSDYRAKRVMVIAPHADDAELAAYGLYSQAREAWVVTLTAGEIEAGHYRGMGLSGTEAARLKGRLRAWDSIAVPRWAGVSAERCVQLGYFCLQLPAMRAHPEQPVASREAGLADTRLFRQFNPFTLPGDDGVPSWHNLVADLRALIERARPEVIVLPDELLDPHPDHVHARLAVLEALAGQPWQPECLLGYANHLHDNDRWPMGNAHSGVALPPLLEPAAPMWPVVLELNAATRYDKAMALGMMHDLTVPLPAKRRLRRALQRLLAGRRWALEGEDEFFRKAVRRHELLWRAER
ncbi:PIG-L family deacetylase [Pseudomonas sp. NPDC007930]|uniref:PIG-L deacetylase family protein n=1 Tax=Pseudomonas sp. NPDC007930 TaxID=3364417 RepID=UPI0036E90E22